MVNLVLSRHKLILDLHQIYTIDALVKDRLAHFTQAHRARRLQIEAHHGHVVHVVENGAVEVNAARHIRVARHVLALLLFQSHWLVLLRPKTQLLAGHAPLGLLLLHRVF